jgi:hypothetical protein
VRAVCGVRGVCDERGVCCPVVMTVSPAVNGDFGTRRRAVFTTLAGGAVSVVISARMEVACRFAGGDRPPSAAARRSDVICTGGIPAASLRFLRNFDLDIGVAYPSWSTVLLCGAALAVAGSVAAADLTSAVAGGVETATGDVPADAATRDVDGTTLAGAASGISLPPMGGATVVA